MIQRLNVIDHAAWGDEYSGMPMDLVPLAAADAELQQTLRAHPSDALATAFQSVGATVSPDLAAAISAWSARVSLLALDVLAEIDPHEAAVRAIGVLGATELWTLQWDQRHLIERKERAHAVLMRGLDTLTFTEIRFALVRGRIHSDWTSTWKTEKYRHLIEHPALSTPGAIFEVLRTLVESDGWGWFEGLQGWLLERLAVAGHPPAAPFLFKGWKSQRGKDHEEKIAEALCATGDREAIAAVAATLGEENPSRAVVEAILCLDPAHAYDSLARFIEPAARLEGLALIIQSSVLSALARDGLRAGGLPLSPSAVPRHWLAADDRWIPRLLALRLDPDPNISQPAREALARADPAVVARHRKPARATNGARAAQLVQLGEAPFEVGESWRPPLSVVREAHRLLLPCAANLLAVHALAVGLPCVTRVPMPGGLALPDEPRDPYTDGCDRVGLHALAMHPSRDEIVVGGILPNRERLLAVIDFQGRELGRLVLTDCEQVRAAVYSGSGRTLWVLFDCDCELHAVAYASTDGSFRRVGSAALGGTYPQPAFVEAHAHPTEEAALFEIACGQEGYWLKSVVRDQGDTVREHMQALSEATDGSVLLGVGGDGALAATTMLFDEDKMQIRTWPTLQVARTATLDGAFVAGAVSEDALLVSVSEVSDTASRFELHSLTTGQLLRAGSWPGGILRAFVGDVVVTTVPDSVRAFRLD